VPVISVLDGCAIRLSVAELPYEIRPYRQPMRGVSDFHGIPDHDLGPLSKQESLGESSGFFFKLEYFPGRFIDENPSRSRGIVRGVSTKISEAAARGGAESVNQYRLAAQFLAARSQVPIPFRSGNRGTAASIPGMSLFHGRERNIQTDLTKRIQWD
jgi:hypothetical protein